MAVDIENGGAIIEIGVMVGRFNPLHRGHVIAIRQMIHHHGRNSLLVIGSANAELSLRNPFTYTERRDFIKKIFPDLTVVGLADQETNKDWFSSLIDIVEAVFPFNYILDIYTGKVEDTGDFDLPDNILLKVVDRDSIGKNFSATEVRKYIVSADKTGISRLVPAKLVDIVYALGRQRMYELLEGK